MPVTLGVALVVGAIIAVFSTAQTTMWAPLQQEWSYGWAGVIGTFAAFWGALAAGFVHYRHERRVAAADRMTAIYLVARSATKEITELDRFVRRAATNAERLAADEDDLKWFQTVWSAWAPDRYSALIAMMEAYPATGQEHAKFMTHILTISIRLKWLHRVAGGEVAQGKVKPETRALLQQAAEHSISALCSMRDELDLIRRSAGVGALAAGGLTPAHPPASSSEHRQRQWSRLTEL